MKTYKILEWFKPTQLGHSIIKIMCLCNDFVAQLVELLTFNQKVVGSIPTEVTEK